MGDLRLILDGNVNIEDDAKEEKGEVVVEEDFAVIDFCDECVYALLDLFIYLSPLGTYNDICINIFIPKEGDLGGVGISVTDLTLTLCCDWDNAYLLLLLRAGVCFVLLLNVWRARVAILSGI